MNKTRYSATEFGGNKPMNFRPSGTLSTVIYAFYDSIAFFTRDTFSNWQVIVCRRQANMKYKVILPLCFERLCWINFTPLFSPLRIFKHRSFRSLWFFTLTRKFSINLQIINIQREMKYLCPWQLSWHLIKSWRKVTCQREVSKNSCIGLLICQPFNHVILLVMTEGMLISS